MVTGSCPKAVQTDSTLDAGEQATWVTRLLSTHGHKRSELDFALSVEHEGIIVVVGGRQVPRILHHLHRVNLDTGAQSLGRIRARG